MLDNQVLPTAVIAINDASAVGVVLCLQDNGYRVPEDVSVVSYDNTSIARVARPHLTSIDYDYEALGKGLVQTVVDVLEGKKTDQLKMIEPFLVVRESSGPAREK